MIRKFYDIIVEPDGIGGSKLFPVLPVPHVPYQKCPKCDGQGTVSKPPWLAGDVHEWSSTAVSFTCDVCHGAKIIPMFPIEQKDKRSVATDDAQRTEP